MILRWSELLYQKTIEPPHDKTNKMACAPSEDSDQPGYPPNLIRVFAVRMKKHWAITYPLSAQRRPWSDWADAIRLGGCPGWSESSLGAHVILLILFVCLCWGLTSQSTIFQSCRDGATASWVINQYFRGVKCLAQGHNTAAVGLEPPTSRSGVRHSTTEPPRSLLILSWDGSIVCWCD